MNSLFALTDGFDPGVGLLVVFLPYFIVFLAVLLAGLRTAFKIFRHREHFTKHDKIPIYSLILGIICFIVLYLERSGEGASGGLLGNDWFFLQAGCVLVFYSWVATKRDNTKFNKPIIRLGEISSRIHLRRILLVGFLLFVAAVFFSDYIYRQNQNATMNRPKEFVAILDSSLIASSPQGTVVVNEDCTFAGDSIEGCSVEILSLNNYSLNDTEISSLSKLYKCTHVLHKEKSGIDCFVPQSDSGYMYQAINDSKTAYLSVPKDKLPSN